MIADGGLGTSGDIVKAISVGADACDELSPTGGTIAVSGGWVQYDTDATGATTPRFLGGGVITNRGETATRLLSQAACFEQLAIHEIGNALGLIDGADGSGVMSPLQSNIYLQVLGGSLTTASGQAVSID